MKYLESHLMILPFTMMEALSLLRQYFHQNWAKSLLHPLLQKLCKPL